MTEQVTSQLPERLRPQLQDEQEQAKLIAGRYEVVQTLQGGMALVYRAIDIRTQKPVALKVLLPHLGRDTVQRRRFIREANQVSKLAHPNIVDVYEVDTSEGYWYIAMELIDGVSLSKYLMQQSGRLPIEDVIQYIDAIAQGLDYAHRKRDPYGVPLEIVHRDVSPQNVLVSVEGGVKLVDSPEEAAEFAAGSLIL